MSGFRGEEGLHRLGYTEGLELHSKRVCPLQRQNQGCDSCREPVESTCGVHCPTHSVLQQTPEYLSPSLLHDQSFPMCPHHHQSSIGAKETFLQLHCAPQTPNQYSSAIHQKFVTENLVCRKRVHSCNNKHPIIRASSIIRASKLLPSLIHLSYITYLQTIKPMRPTTTIRLQTQEKLHNNLVICAERKPDISATI